MTKSSKRRRVAPVPKRAAAPVKRSVFKRIVKFIIFSCALLTLGLGVFAYFIDQRVKARLAQGNSITSSGIYTTSLRYRSGISIEAPRIQKELLARGYVASASEPKNPGEFQFNDSNLRLISQAFTDERGDVHTPQTFEINLARGKITYKIAKDKFEPVEELVLEPLLITPLGDEESRVSSYRNFETIPLVLQHAFLAIEDQRFYSHFGIDPLGIFRAIYSNLRAHELVQGGSTITQQLAKNLFFSSERSIERKVGEALAALSLEFHLNKNEIFERYLNEVYLGREGNSALHGVAAASRSFFGKDVSDLSVAEAALLAGLVKAPSFFAPRKHPDRAIERRNIVLKAMLDQGYIKQAQFDSAVESKLKLVAPRPQTRIAPYFVAALQQSIDQAIGDDAGNLSGMRVYTGLTPELQRCAEEAVAHGLSDIERRYPSAKRKARVEGALVAIEPFSGLVKAWVGGRNFGANQFDHVSLGIRQAGSTIKPFLYLAALEQNRPNKPAYTPISVLLDQPMTMQTGAKSVWSPEDYDHEYRGAVTLRYALERSLNLPAAHLVQDIGVASVASVVERFHVADQVPKVPAIALGAVDTSLQKLTAAFAALANGGVYVKPRLFTRINFSNNEELIHSDFVEERVAREASSFVIVNLMRGVIERGTANIIRRMGFTLPAAGKTGTSDQARDAWFIGFTPVLAVGVWVGFDDNSKLGLTGASAAAPIWAEFMKCANPVGLNFVKPEGVIEVALDGASGLRASQDCPASNRITELFISGTEPTGVCTASQTQEVIPLPPEMPHDQAPANDPNWRDEERNVWDRLFSH